MSVLTLQAEGLACAVGYRTLFSDLAFTLRERQWLMLTGPNGSGKSTLLRLLAGLIRPSAGAVRWAGRVRDASDPEWHAQVLYQGHAPGWKDQLTASENLQMQAALDLGEARAGADAVSGALERVGLTRQRNLQFVRLSAGQRRRLGLARLSLVRRPLWLLDEPTTALDADGQRLFAGLLDEYLNAGGCAVIATHLAFPTDSPPVSLRLGEANAAGAPAGPG